MVAVPTYALGLDEKFLRFVQSERGQVNLSRDAPVESAFVADDFRQHPSRGTSADEEFHAILH